MLNHIANRMLRLEASGTSPVGVALQNDRSAPKLSDLVDMLSAVSGRLAAASAGAIEAEIQHGLEQVREFLAVDRCALYRVMTDRDADEIVSQAAATGMPPLPDSIFGAAGVSSLTRVIRGAETPALSWFDALRADTLADRIFYAELKIAALLVIPLSVSGPLKYCLCVASSRAMEEWPRDLIAGLRLLGSAFANAVLRAGAEEALGHAKRTLATAQGIAQMGSYERNTATDAFTGCAEAYRIFGIQPGASVPFLSCVHPEDRAALERATAGMQESYSVEYRIVRPDGEVRVIHDEGHLASSQAEGQRAMGTVHDVTDTRRTQQDMRELRMQLWHADRVARTGALSASLAHELRQPLAAILSNAQAALRLFSHGKPDFAEIEQILQDVVRDDKRASEIIASVHNMLRRRETDHEPVDLAPAVNDLLSLLRSEVAAAQVEIEVELEAGLQIVADRGQIQQVLLNLVMNALEAMREVPVTQRRLCVSVMHTDAGKVRCAVRDQGTGIAQENLEKVFDPFWTTKPQGLGMGLSVCRSIVEAHNGEMWVESSAGAGATFFFEVPAAAPAAIAPTMAAEERAVPALGAHQPDATVLVVDDDPAVRTALARLLQGAGWKVEQFDSPQQLLDMPPFAGTGCVVLDVQMPGMTGPQVHDRMSERGLDFPVVYLTAHADIATSVRAMKKGAVDFLLKPVDDGVLLEAIRNAVERHAAARVRTGKRERLEAGLRRLTPQQRVVMRHVVLGHANKRIAFDLGICEYTVKVHRSRMMRKMQVCSVAELVHLCESAGVRTDEVKPETP